MTVQQELQSRLKETDRLRRTQVERAHYEAELARRRFLRVVSRQPFRGRFTEADWNQKLRILTEAQQEYDRQRQADQTMLSEGRRARIPRPGHRLSQALAGDPRTPNRERKRMVRLLLEDVTLHKGTQLTVQIRFKGGAQQVLTLPVPARNFEARKTRPQVIAEIDRLLDHDRVLEIASILNQRGCALGRRPRLRLRLRGGGATRLPPQDSLGSPSRARSAHSRRGCEDGFVCQGYG